MTGRSFTLRELARHVDGRVEGEASSIINGLGSLGTAVAGQISHLSSPAYRADLPATAASAVILNEADLAACPTNALVVENPYLAFARISQLWEQLPPLADGIAPSAQVDPSAQVHASVALGPGVVIGAECVIGAGAKIYANTVIGVRCSLGDDVRVMPNVTLYSGVELGARSIVHANVVIGADGFGYTPGADGRLEAIAQLGGVTIGADVSIGAGTMIDRGAIDDTVIEEGVKIDNHVQIGHNCRVGAHSIICGCVAIAGSTKIGRHCVIGGGVGIGGDKPIVICDQALIGATTHVTGSITEPGAYAGGTMHNKLGAWKRNALRFQQLDELAKRIGRIEKRQNG